MVFGSHIAQEIIVCHVLQTAEQNGQTVRKIEFELITDESIVSPMPQTQAGSQ